MRERLRGRVVAAVGRRIARVGVAVGVLAALGVSAPTVASASTGFVNGGFETGSFSPGWTSTSQGAGQWSVTSTGTSHCNAPVTVAPDQGTFSAMWDMADPSWGLLTSDAFTVPTGVSLSLDLAYDNQVNTWHVNSASPYSLSAPSNEWLRVDVIAAGANPQSLSSSDILATVFDSQSGSPAYQQGWTNLSVSLASLAGQSVRLRVATVNTVGCMPVWLDNVALGTGVSIPNGGFESTASTFSDWTAVNTGSGAWAPTTTGLASCGNVTNAPTQGTTAALFDMNQPATGVLVSSPFTVPTGGALSVDYAYDNLAGSWGFNSTSPFDITGPSNQWLRIDVIAAGANPQSLSPSDILATVFDSQSGTPASNQAWTTGTVNLSAFAGQSVQLRAVDVTSLDCMPMWLDNVVVGPGANPVANPSFDNNIPDWSVYDAGYGSWALTTSGLASCGHVTNLPTQGSTAALFDMGDVSSGILVSTPFTVPSGGSLSVDYAYDNQASSWGFSSTAPFDLGAPNQWMRIDVIAAGANPQSLSPSDVIATVFDSQSGTPTHNQTWTTGTVNLSAFAGQSVELRAINVTTLGCQPMWLDNVVLHEQLAPLRASGLSMAASGGYLTASWLPSAGATSYTCTLLYGFNNPSKFTVQTSGHSCSFAYAAGSVPFGIQVVAQNASGSSPANAVFYSPPPPTKMVCVRGTHRRVVSGAPPACPRGWRPLHRTGAFG